MNHKFLNRKAKVKLELDSANEEEIIKPTIAGKMEHIKNESLMLFGYIRDNGRNYRMFYGIGVVYRVVKGERCDLIYINFGIFKTQKPRLVVAYDNHARRQTMTLKRGQVCQVYGLCKTFMTEFEMDEEKRKGIRMGLYAKAINGWYVPTMLDIRKMPKNEDLTDPSEKEEQLMDKFEDVLDSFLNGTGEEE